MHFGPILNRDHSARAIASWLLICCALILFMVVLGGVTRLTHSGLSIVEWKPITGVLPPLTHAEWEGAFQDYQQYPEYQKLNRDMTLEGFKSIFWLEYLHRLLGRLLGLVFFVPFLYFLFRGKISEVLLPRLLFIFMLGGSQGLLGWYMVKSGLVDRPDVSQYRLTAHLGLAFLIYGYILWVALGLLRYGNHPTGTYNLRKALSGLTVLIFLTVLSGGFVAGTDAGFVYNTFPLMDGRWIPEGILQLSPAWRNLFENVITIQFVHRLMAITTFCCIVSAWLWALGLPLPSRVRSAFHCLFGAGILQVIIGVSTLLFVVPVPLAAAHQAGAMILFSAALWVSHELNST
jgi:cytochrome c oxidase assembly protein subunit 15